MLVSVKHKRVLNDRMEVHIHDLIVTHFFVKLLEYGRDSIQIIRAAYVMVAFASPGRHICIYLFILCAQPLSYLVRISFRQEYAVTRISHHNNIASVESLQIVILHDGMSGKLIRECYVRSLQEVVLHVVHGLNALTHLLSQSLERCSVPCLQIFLSRLSDIVDRQGRI